MIQNIKEAAVKPFAKIRTEPSVQGEDLLPFPDESTQPIQELASALISKVFERVPETERYAIAASPAALRPYNLLIPRIRHALQLAGLQEWALHHPTASTAALWHMQFGLHPDDQKFSYGKEHLRGLFITNTETAMILADVEGEVNPPLVPGLNQETVFIKSSVKPTKEQLTNDIRTAIEQFVKTKRNNEEYWDLEYDRFVLLGSLENQDELKDSIQLVFGDRADESSFRSMTPEDRLYAAARGAADIAREGLESTFIYCLPNDWCPRPDQLVPVTAAEEGGTNRNTPEAHEEL